MSFIELKNNIHTFFNPNIATKKLAEEVKLHRIKVKELRVEYTKLSDWNKKYVDTLTYLTDAMEAMVWRKDEDHRYILANSLVCSTIFGIKDTDACISILKGKTNVELFEEAATEIPPVFRDIGKVSDDYVKNENKVCHFLEAGTLHGKEHLFYIVKTPSHDAKGNFSGSVGMGWNVTTQSDFLVEQLNRWIFAGKTVKLYQFEEMFCYAITPELKKCDIFNHICPTPHNKESCTNELCEGRSACKGDLNDTNRN